MTMTMTKNKNNHIIRVHDTPNIADAYVKMAFAHIHDSYDNNIYSNMTIFMYTALRFKNSIFIRDIIKKETDL